MTTITYQGSEASRHSAFRFVSFVGPVLAIAARLRDAWHRRQTERMLEGLGPDIRKDIGWPTMDTAPDRK